MGLNARRHIEAHFDRTLLAGRLAALFEDLLSGRIKPKTS